MKIAARTGLLLLCVIARPALAGEALVPTFSATGSVPVKSWKTQRDDRITKQDQDYSCGAASLATILNSYYGQSVTEEALLKVMDKGDLRASFEDMARALPSFGFRGVGYAASFEQLSQLRIPVVVYLKHRKDDHFSVVRGINATTIWLADPSLGNRRMSKTQFLEMWETRGDAALKGKLLAILPSAQSIPSLDDFFTRTPSPPAAAAVLQQAIRQTP